MGAETALALGIATLLGGAAYGASEYTKFQDRKTMKSAPPATQDIGNLTTSEAQASASKKAFRTGLYFTSPTGTLGTGTRGRSRLMGA